MAKKSTLKADDSSPSKFKRTVSDVSSKESSAKKPPQKDTSTLQVSHINQTPRYAKDFEEI